MVLPEQPSSLDDVDSFASAGPAQIAGAAGGREELRCAECGYAIVARAPLPPCPMCRAEAWEEPRWRPFSRLDEFASLSDLGARTRRRR